ncbi:heavy metal translocating P-type ATPase [Litoreibacter roseus]|uniref:Copper-translocating P-type ATPase n=1 Tax=Litoreibacter roseus TaxID=2601869 RepID=A0A6N6JGA7_9RHOB|nr:heavy metal translocating P-type ATPase [Litoreibacter roseus]GFE64850.1 copper-translocating P-type ATPase [Litoreibacter roseus]
MTVAACPGCATGPDADTPSVDRPDAIQISLPTVHCAACISKVERALMQVDGVVAARVNLGLKRVRIQTAPGITAEPLLTAIRNVGFDALELDSATLGQQKDKTGLDLLIRIAVSGFAMMNVMLLSVSVWSGATEATRDMFHWISAMIALPAIIYAGQPFYRHALSALAVRKLNMDVPISLAILLAAGMSLYETSQSGAHAYFDAALSLTFFLLIGRYLDHRTRSAARSAAKELAALEIPRVTRLIGTDQETAALEDIAVGDRILVPAGVRVPLDGEVVRGESEVDRSFITGESLPHAARTGDAILAGEVNLTGPLELRVTARGEDTTLRKMAALIEIAETARNTYTGLADRAAQIYAPAVHLLALAAFVVWLAISGDVRLSMNIAIAVLIITCPCALGLAVPAVMTAASGRLFRSGLLLKNATALERLAEVDTVVFDKTGTLTEGQVTVDTSAFSDLELAVLKGLAQTSRHPVSRAICAALPKDITPAQLSSVREEPGTGITAMFEGQRVRLGSAALTGAASGPALRIGDAVPKTIQIEEQLRPGVLEAVQDLKKMGLHVALFTGDQDRAAQYLGARVGITDITAAMSPSDKSDALAAMRINGRKVLMVGDGMNDAPALAQAFVSMAPATATDVARVASDMVLLNPDLGAIPEAARVAVQAKARVTENFAVSVAYNVIAVPIALLGFATPLMAAIAMSLSSLSVLVNALRLRA